MILFEERSAVKCTEHTFATCQKRLKALAERFRSVPDSMFKLVKQFQKCSEGLSKVERLLLGEISLNVNCWLARTEMNCSLLGLII